MTITATPYLKETYLSHINTINALKRQMKKVGADKKELQQRINILQEMADAADSEITDIQKREEY